MDIERRRKIAIKACKKAGKILKDNFKKTIEIESKTNKDLVTNIDKKADETTIKLIKKTFPKDGILSEESKGLSSETGYRWVIDPMDGTHNFVHNIDIFGVSIAVEFKGEVILGVIYMPWTDEFYIAQKGKGAYCNGKKIEVSKRELNKATLVYDSSIRYNKEQMLEVLGKLTDKVFNVRMFGSSARSLTYVAEGRVDVEVEFNDKVWDFASGLLLIEEAGGKVTDFEGRPWSLDIKGYIASNKTIHQDILDTVRNSLEK